MKVLVCGDREYTNKRAIFLALYGMPKDTIIINGACRGADKISTDVAKSLGLGFREYSADWDKHGKKAGPIRNREMLDKEQPDLVIAFHSYILESKGTKDMCLYAKSKSVPVILITG